ncbi:MAG: hypothetical protein H6702_18700 [Myxococcales bacterium]|nr:hypothetical protein [Myxococcales bacterium]
MTDDRGLRAIETHKAAGRPLRLALPGGDRRWALSRLTRQAHATELREYPLTADAQGRHTWDSATPEPVLAKGTAQVFQRLFRAPFRGDAVVPFTPGRVETPPAPWVHGPTARLGVESGHLDGLAALPTLGLGYRVARDRWSLGAEVGVGLATDVTSAALTYDLRRYGLALTPRYDLWVGPVVLALGARLGAALEEQVITRPIVAAGGQAATSEITATAVSGLWAGTVVLEWPLGGRLSTLLEGYAGARGLEVGGGFTQRAVAGGAVAAQWLWD